MSWLPFMHLIITIKYPLQIKQKLSIYQSKCIHVKDCYVTPTETEWLTLQSTRLWNNPCLLYDYKKQVLYWYSYHIIIIIFITIILKGTFHLCVSASSYDGSSQCNIVVMLSLKSSLKVPQDFNKCLSWALLLAPCFPHQNTLHASLSYFHLSLHMT